MTEITNKYNKPIILICMVLTVLCGVYYLHNNIFRLYKNANRNDFAHLYLSSYMVGHNKGAYIYNLNMMGVIAKRTKVTRFNPYVYPPLPALLCSPIFSQLNYNQAWFIWFSLNHLFALLSVLCLLFLVEKKYRLALALLLSFLMAFAHPVYRTISAGQWGLLLLLLLSASLWAIRKNQLKYDFLAGLLIALAANIKILPGALCFWFWLSGRKKLAVYTFGLILGVFLLSFIPLGRIGWDGFWDMLSQMRYGFSTAGKFGVNYQVEPANQSPAALWYRLFHNKPAFALSFSYLTGLGLMLFLFYKSFFKKRVLEENYLGYYLWVFIPILCSSLMWDHYMVIFFLFLPYLIIIKPLQIKNNQHYCYYILLSTLSLVFLTIPFNFWNVFFSSGFNSLWGFPRLYGALIFLYLFNYKL